MKVPPPPRALVPALAAVAGVVVAHVVDYAVLFPRAGARADHLAATGHSYWPVAMAVAVGAGIVALGLTAGRGALRAVRRAAPHSGAANRRELAWLLACQATAFAVLEAGERGLVGLPPSVVLHSPEFWLGLLLQLPVAWAAIRVLAALERTAFRLVAAARAPRLSRGRALPAPRGRGRAPRSVAVASPARPRAPPLAA